MAGPFSERSQSKFRLNSELRANSGQIPSKHPKPHYSLVILSVATPAEPRGEKNFFVVQIFGCEKLLKFVEKCRCNIFKRPEGAKHFSNTFRIVFRIFFSRFSNPFSY